MLGLACQACPAHSVLTSLSWTRVISDSWSALLSFWCALFTVAGTNVRTLFTVAGTYVTPFPTGPE